MLKQYNFKKLCLRKKLDKLPTHPNNYTDSKLFWENLTQHRITPLIGRIPKTNSPQTTSPPKTNPEDGFPADKKFAPEDDFLPEAQFPPPGVLHFQS